MGGTQGDVIIVGRGPVGQLAAILLGVRGWKVTLVERRPDPYRLPRAVTFDHEVARVLAAAGLGGGLSAISEPATEYEWRNAAGQVLLRFAWDRPGSMGWPRASMFAQPVLETLLAERVAAMPNIEVRPGHDVVTVQQDGRRAVVGVRNRDGAEEDLAARYVIGCDGANSTVRRFMDTTVTDLGFFRDWLIIDVIPTRVVGARTQQYALGKSYPGFGPIGPAVVTPDELPDPDDLAIGCELNGEPMQDARTSEMIFSVPELVERLSAVATLHPGDLVFTGTPGGIGGTRTPPRFLTPGDELVSRIDGLGTMRTTFEGT